MPRNKRASSAVKSSLPKRQKNVAVAPSPDPIKEKVDHLLELPIDWLPLTKTLPIVDPLLVEEYKKFLVLKVANDDTRIEGLKLSPSGPVDEVWHSHMLLPRHYVDVCSILLQRSDAVIEHSVLTAQQPERPVRYATTLELYEKFWGKPPQKYWPEEKAVERKEFQIFVKSLDGKHTTFVVKPDQLISKLLEECESRLGNPYRLIFAGKQLQPDRTIRESSILPESCLVGVLNLRGC